MHPTSTITVDRLRGDILAHSMRQLHENPSRLPEGYHSVKVEPGIAMLVEPVNDPAFVFVPPMTVHKFESEPGSGTDNLRQRMRAGLFFRQVVEAAQRAAAQASGDLNHAVRRRPKP